jgi:Spc19
LLALQVFLLVNEGTIKKCKADLTEEVEPAINELIERAEQGLRNLYKKESVLQAKVLVDCDLLSLICLLSSCRSRKQNLDQNSQQQGKGFHINWKRAKSKCFTNNGSV